MTNTDGITNILLLLGSGLELFGLLIVIAILAWLSFKSWYFRDSAAPRLARSSQARFKSGW